MTELRFLKRYRMDRDLRYGLPAEPPLPDGYYLVPWDDGLVLRHAEVKFASFCDELDQVLFPCLSTLDGCVSLMEAIRFGAGFVPGATWLVAYGAKYCGTVQGLRDGFGMGAIQNLGVIPTHRGRGLGAALLYQALIGFKTVGIAKAMLEVTAKNDAAVELYRRLGFRARRAVYKQLNAGLVSFAEPVAAG